ncbi:phenylpyruvate tautomerase PptA (4-oxalocrotonate tautomerase family) [Paraburkholderia youngii]|uniref:tautomerase family protein n=1 Tax=Paraburkholderia TaxID=1822464 RepID=UPI0034CFCBF3
MPMIDALWPEDALTSEAEARLVRELTDILIRAEGYDPASHVAPRVWVFPTEIPDGAWGTGGAIWMLPDIHALLAGDSERDAGVARLARRRLEKARITLEAALNAASAGIASKSSLERPA